MAELEEETSGGDFEVGTWKLILFFLLILVVDTTWEFIDEQVTHGIRRRKKKGLMHAWEQIKFEVMALGLVSLLLVVFEEYLLMICVHKKTKDEADSPAESPVDEHDTTITRHLLASSDGDSCPDGKEALWSSALIHKVHILIFLIAISHVVYALISLGISMLSMRRFHAFEKVAQEGSLLPLPTDQLLRDGESRIMFGIRQGFRQFTHPIDIATYIALRRLFIEAVQVDPSFDFANFVTEYLAEEFSHVVRLELMMWIIAIVWIAFPAQAYAGIWLTVLFCSLSIIAGAKLHVIAMHLARRAYSLYFLCNGDNESVSSRRPSEDGDHDGRGSSPEFSFGVRKFLASPGESRITFRPAHSLQALTVGSSPSMQTLGSGSADKDEIDRSAFQGLQRFSVGPEPATVDGAPVTHPSQSGAHGILEARFYATPSHEAGVRSNGKAARPVAEATTQEEVGEASVGPLRPSSILEHSQSAHTHRAIRASTRPQSKRARLAPGTSATVDGIKQLYALEDHSSSVRRSSFHLAAVTAGLTGHMTQSSPSSVSSDSSREFCATCLGYGRPDRQKNPRQVKKWETEQEYKALFWFKKPRLMLRIFQYAYFENALSLAVLVFAFWQNEPSMVGGGVGAKNTEIKTGSVVAGVLLLVLDLLLLVHSSYFVLPVHALTAAAANFGSQLKVLQAAKQHRVRPDILYELQEQADEDDDMFAQAFNNPSYSPSRRMNQLPPAASGVGVAVGGSASAIPSAAASHDGSSPATPPVSGEAPPEGPVQVFASNTNSAASAPSAPQSPIIRFLDQRGEQQQQQAELQQPAAPARSRIALSRMSAAPVRMHAPSSAAPAPPQGAPLAGAVRRRPNLIRSSCPGVGQSAELSASKPSPALPATKSGVFPSFLTGKPDKQLATPRPDLKHLSTASVGYDSTATTPRAPGSARHGSMEPPGHADHSGAPSVIEGLMEAMVQHRRRMDQQAHMVSRTSHRSVSPPPSDMHAQPLAPARPRRSLERHSDVSATLALSAAVQREARGGAGGAGPSVQNGTGEGSSPRKQGPRVPKHVPPQGGSFARFIPKSTSAEELTPSEARL